MSEAPETVTDVETELEGLEVDAPLVGIIMGSKSDMDTMEGAAKVLRAAGILEAEKIGKEVYLRINKELLEESLANVLDYVRSNA